MWSRLDMPSFTANRRAFMFGSIPEFPSSFFEKEASYHSLSPSIFDTLQRFGPGSQDLSLLESAKYRN